jgi:DNA-binding CsgD family transcriptional regulator
MCTYNDWKRPDLERLTGLIAALADVSASPALLPRVPTVLARALNLQPTTFAIIRTANNLPEIAYFGHSVATVDGEPALRQRVLDVYRQHRPLAAGDAPALRDAITPEAVRQEGSELVLSRPIDADHRLVLIVTYHGAEAPPEVLIDTLDLVTSQLVKLIAAMLAWIADPATLGGPFDRLTDREWVVLQGLQSEDGEKQLADRLELSPHTLHSHIKSIYRKLGVQGRLPVLLRLNAAQRGARLRTLTGRPQTAPATQGTPAAVAAG